MSLWCLPPQVTAPGEVGLATIEEDAEEDSGAESSGHWMFSADNTDTDSVIHVPAALTPASMEPSQRRPPEGKNTLTSPSPSPSLSLRTHKRLKRRLL